MCPAHNPGSRTEAGKRFRPDACITLTHGHRARRKNSVDGLGYAFVPTSVPEASAKSLPRRTRPPRGGLIACSTTTLLQQRPRRGYCIARGGVIAITCRFPVRSSL